MRSLSFSVLRILRDSFTKKIAVCRRCCSRFYCRLHTISRCELFVFFSACSQVRGSHRFDFGEIKKKIHLISFGMKWDLLALILPLVFSFNLHIMFAERIFFFIVTSFSLCVKHERNFIFHLCLSFCSVEKFQLDLAQWENEIEW